MIARLSPPPGTFVGCERFPGFGSALDHVVLGASGRFNITTTDFLYSRRCDAAADLEWGHSGTFSQRANSTSVYAFRRDELWLRAHSTSGLAFGRVLCPKLSLSLGAVTSVPLERVASLCSSLTFNNCETYFDALEYTEGGLRRSSTPSCNSVSQPQPDGPLLNESSRGGANRHSDRGSCGDECTTDADCAGCGLDGKCSHPPDSGLPAIAASCVDAPADPPADPPPNASATFWPLVSYTAQQRLVSYNDNTSKRDVADGKIFYDGPGARLRNEWAHYYNGRLQQQWWVRDAVKNSSRFYVNSKTALGISVCVTFETVDGATGGTSVGVQRTDWMARCVAAGYGTHVGRERVDGEWVDHWSCNMSFPSKQEEKLVFQSWNALGLGVAAAGTELRVTGGDSHPDKTSGTPRLQSNFYTNLTAWDVDPKVFEHPRFCIPLGGGGAGGEQAAVARYFGVVGALTTDHMRLASFRHRAAYLPHAEPAEADLSRAATPKPGAHATGATVSDAMAKLNRFLIRETGLATRPCDEWTVAELHAVQRELMAARSPALQEIYGATADRRSLPYANTSAMTAAHAEQAAALRQAGLGYVRDGLCKEAVMMYIHHLSTSAQDEIKAGTLVMPLLPERELRPPPGAETQVRCPLSRKLHKDYVTKASCAICHVEKR